MTLLRAKQVLVTALIATALSTLTACSAVKKEMGVGRNSPDEFLVVKRAPLTLPPDYTLRPPGNPGDTQSADTTADTAKTIVLGTPKTPVTKGAAENALLNKIGAATASPDIRQQIDEENGYISLKNRSVAQKLIFWNDEEPPQDNIPSSLVDPVAEASRIKQNQAAGKPITDGTVPVIEKKKGTLDKIF